MKTGYAICTSILFAIFILTSGLIVYIVILGITHREPVHNTQSLLSAGYSTQESLQGDSYSIQESLPGDSYSTQDTANASGETYSYGSAWAQDEGSAETTFYGGTASSGVSYGNDRMGIEFTVPAGYRMLTNEEMAELTGITTDLLDNGPNSSQPEDDEAAAGAKIEMMCVSPTGTPNVNITSIALPSSSTTLNQCIEEYMSAARELLYVDAAIDDTAESVTVAGRKFVMLHGTINIPSIEDIEKNQDHYFAKTDDRLFVICLTYMKDEADAAAALMNAFQAK